MSCLPEAVGVLHLGGTCSWSLGERQRFADGDKISSQDVGAKIGHSKLYLSRWHTLRALLQLKRIMRSHPHKVLSPFLRTSSSTVGVHLPHPLPACLAHPPTTTSLIPPLALAPQWQRIPYSRTARPTTRLFLESRSKMKELQLSNQWKCCPLMAVPSKYFTITIKLNAS